MKETTVNERQICITTYDIERLESLINTMEPPRTRKKLFFDQLNQELERAKVVDPQDIPRDVITMNSVIRIKDLESGEETTYTLVFPSDASIERRRISILSAIGTALIGYSVGDIVECQVPSGLKRLKILEISYQPEASGHYDR
ncbi:MAG: nucleoside diphosphate kinase regulator [Syntrophales bacterium]|nr:nucleoside diphosphate kinase regulator [Syntrophales bacterium]